MQKTVRETCEVIAAFLEGLYQGSFEGNEQTMLVHLAAEYLPISILMTNFQPRVGSGAVTKWVSV